MRAKELPFEGIWHVVAQEMRIAGEWQREYDFDPGEWSIGFLPDCRYGEIFHPEGERTVCGWTFDAAAGIISIISEPPGTAVKCVFRRIRKTAYLYFYDELPHVPPDGRAIIGHHANMRYKLVRV